MRYFPRRYSRPGSSPGTLVQHETAAAIPPQRRLIQYSPDEIVDQPITPGDEFPPPRAGFITWIHIQGTPTAALMEQLGDRYELHPLALEDVINAGQRTKFDIYDNHYFIVANYLTRNDADHLTAEQVSLFLGDGFVISVHEGPHDICDPVRTRLRAKKTLRTSGPDYLTYALLDLVVDNGFPLLEAMSERLEGIEDEVLDNPANDSLDRIHVVRRELSFMRRMLWPQREIVNSLARDAEDRITATTRFYFRDVYDHTVQILELIESYRESAASLLDLYLSTLNNRMNEVMKVLTIIATIFLPLSFVVGLYGMNFSTEASPWNMPELHWRYGYLYSLGVMTVIAAGMLVVFKRKRWF
ncbi:MAG TPA: magnesium/cobalt transporter CorA [Gammaproteobacteria bacterium]|nr:magnesium/cobalt transporter CorA [Gammaproteobacteria bacterium]